MPAIKKTLCRHDWVNLILALIIFAAIIIQIWLGYPEKPPPAFYLLIFALTGSANYLLGDRVGLWPKKAEQILGLIGLMFYFWMLWFFLAGTEIDIAGQLWLKIGRGIGWALGQQYLLNGFFVNRLVGFFRDTQNKNIPWLAALFFAGVHTPNWFLMGVTFIGGYLCARIFLKERNLYLLAIVHVLISLILLRLIPDSITRGFRIGPGYFSR